MSWDLGPTGLALMAAIALGFGALGGLMVGGSLLRRAVGAVITTVACFGVGVLTSEWLFGEATEAELQPNIDGLSRDEVLLSSLLTTVLVVVVLRLVGRRQRRVDDASATPAGGPASGASVPTQRAGGRHRAETSSRQR